MTHELRYISKSNLSRECKQDVDIHSMEGIAYPNCQKPSNTSNEHDLENNIPNVNRPTSAKTEQYSNHGSQCHSFERKKQQYMNNRVTFVDENNCGSGQVTKLKPETPRRGQLQIYDNNNNAAYDTYIQYEFDPYKQPCCSLHSIQPETAQPFSMPRALPQLLYPQAQSHAHEVRPPPSAPPLPQPHPHRQQRHSLVPPVADLVDQAQRARASLIPSLRHSEQEEWSIYREVFRVFVDLTVVTIRTYCPCYLCWHQSIESSELYN